MAQRASGVWGGAARPSKGATARRVGCAAGPLAWARSPSGTGLNSVKITSGASGLRRNERAPPSASGSCPCTGVHAVRAGCSVLGRRGASPRLHVNLESGDLGRDSPAVIEVVQDL